MRRARDAERSVRLVAREAVAQLNYGAVAKAAGRPRSLEWAEHQAVTDALGSEPELLDALRNAVVDHAPAARARVRGRDGQRVGLGIAALPFWRLDSILGGGRRLPVVAREQLVGNVARRLAAEELVALR